MGLRGWWAAWVELRRTRRGPMWRTCGGCRRYLYRLGTSGLCERCLSQR
jgi:hypothetical protein